MVLVLIVLLAILSPAVYAQSSVNLTGGVIGTATFSGLGSFTGDFRVDMIEVKNCSNPNNGGTHNIFSGVISLQWIPTANTLHVRDWNSTGGNILTMNTSAWPAEGVDLRYQRHAGQWLGLEKWNYLGGGYESKRGVLTASNVIGYTTSTLGAALTGCSVGAIRIYRNSIEMGSAPPSAIADPDTDALRVWTFDDEADPAADTSGNGGDMDFSSTPSWDPEEAPMACWATAAGNSTAGSPITLAAHTRGSVASRVWKITSKPTIGTARLSDYSGAAPFLLNATAGTYGFTLTEIDGDGEVAECSTSQVVSSPVAGTGKFLKYGISVDMDAIAGTDSVKISVVQPNGLHVVGSPYRCWESPCRIFADDTGMGLHTFKVERLNASGQVISTSPWKPLKTSYVTASVPPAPTREGIMPLMFVPYIHTDDFADEFLAKRGDYRIAGGEGQPSPNSNPLTYNPDFIWAYYLDLATYSYTAQHWEVVAHAATNGWPYEDYLMHSDKDHGNTQAWTFINRFGEDERAGGVASKKGVMIWNGSSFLAGPDDPDINPGVTPTPDHSVAAWNSAIGDVPIGNNHIMYVGYPEPFDIVNIVVSTPQSGGTVTWEYWDSDSSSWTSLSVSDDTSDSTITFTASGQVRFTPPEHWGPTIVNSSKNKFWIRATVAGAGTTPILSRVYGDEWYTYSSPVGISAISSHASAPTFTCATACGLIVGDMVKFGGTTGGWVTPLTAAASPSGGYWLVRTVPTSTTFTVQTINTTSLGTYPGGFTVHKRSERGWDGSHESITTVAGGFAYNPTPPAGATAKFRYQARMRSFFSSGIDWFLTNHHTGDPVRYWGRYMAEKIVARLTGGEGFKGFMADNADSIPENISRDTYLHMEWPQSFTPWTDANATPVRDSMAAMFTQLRDYVHSHVPGAKIGGNATFRSGNICFVMDFCLFENRMTAFVPYAYTELVNSVGAVAAAYDTLGDEEKNPLGSIGFMHCTSPDTLDPVDGSGVQYWYDKADRRTLGCLATHYIGWNGITTSGFSWNSGTFTYNTDDHYWFMCCDTVLTSPIAADSSSSVKTFTVEDTSMYWNPAALELVLVLGDPPNAEYISVPAPTTSCPSCGWSGNTIRTTSMIYQSWPTGTVVRARKIGHQARTVIPRERLLFQSQWFEAMAVDIGVPDPSGHNAGERDLAWKTPAEYGGATGSLNMYRRDFTLATVIIRPTNTASGTAANTRAARMNGCSDKMDLGGTYYRLHSDGKTEALAYTQIALREGEAFIGLKTPTAEVTEVPAWQQNTCP
jgi:hypothetical protein